MNVADPNVSLAERAYLRNCRSEGAFDENGFLNFLKVADPLKRELPKFGRNLLCESMRDENLALREKRSVSSYRNINKEPFRICFLTLGASVSIIEINQSRRFSCCDGSRAKFWPRNFNRPTP